MCFICVSVFYLCQGLLYLIKRYSSSPHSVNILRGNPANVHRTAPGFAFDKGSKPGNNIFHNDYYLLNSKSNIPHRTSYIIHHPSHIIHRTYNDKTSSGVCGSYIPFFISRITVPLSNAFTVCHCPAGMFRATTEPLGESSMRSVQILSSSS